MENNKDQILLKRIKDGEVKAFDALFFKYWKPLMAAAFTRLKSKDLSEDVVQEVFIDIWKRKASLEIKSSVEVYLFTAVKYGVLKSLDAAAKLETLEGHGKINFHSSDKILELEELYDLIESKLDLLPETNSKIFRLYKYDGLTASEISKLTGMAPQSVHNSIQKTVNFLKSELKEYSPLIFLVFMNCRI
ncbi:RNA polymerase sigma factor [Arthrospiribacter ruber]|uniref:Sigma-70 family RNA polymerase sigma factor n=1 Tax=Arthrospiribacter ruber TaxID=2487934 RepID=A0A951IZD3_9BACT|nr:sigma-70 family RNA polymerase sigma factor [Arthrospiribacter ruber]MBW3468676.1 sigma-70 family RNA polymerase sigma factor [Arthrospiribacter ruber]